MKKCMLWSSVGWGEEAVILNFFLAVKLSFKFTFLVFSPAESKPRVVFLLEIFI